MIVAYFIVWFVVMMMVPPRKHQRGYIWRLLRKLPPWVFIRGEFNPREFRTLFRTWLRFIILAWALLGVLSVIGVSGGLHGALFYTTLTVIELDDLYNGDDEDRKRRWEGVKNKVKWLWTPAMEPARLGGGA